MLVSSFVICFTFGLIVRIALSLYFSLSSTKYKARTQQSNKGIYLVRMDMNNLALFITPFTTLLFVNSVINNSMDSFIMCGTFFLASIVRRNFICQNQKYQIPKSNEPLVLLNKCPNFSQRIPDHIITIKK